VPAFHHPHGNPLGIDRGVVGTDEEEADEEAGVARAANEVELVRRREHRFERQTALVFEAVLTNLGRPLRRLDDGFGRVPVAKLVAGNEIRIDVDATAHPLVHQQLLGDRGLARTIGPGDDDQPGPCANGHGHVRHPE
jgi:hypothetical protein